MTVQPPYGSPAYDPQPYPQQPPAPAYPQVYFDGGVASFVGTAILAWLITVFTLGLLYPLAYVMLLRWKTEHTVIEGRRMQFHGTGMGMFGMWLKWWFFIIITLGIYSFWVVPRLNSWACSKTTLNPPGMPLAPR